ncbi:MAG: methionyl-tRNA formyltransferase, partial [Steroidobacteraceae bacterium]
MRVAFAGTPQFALPSLEALLAHHHVAGVLTQPDRPSGRGRSLTPSPVKELAQARGVPLLQPATLKSEAVRAQLALWAPQALVVVAYGLLLPPAVLGVAPLGCVNVHASLLPRWRGAAPVQRAILAGDTESGVSIMAMDEGLDSGPVLLRRRHPIDRHETGGSLLRALSTLGAAALLEALEGLALGTLNPQAQSSAEATYAPKIAKAEARIDWSRDASAIERQVRAFSPVPMAETRLRGEQLKVSAAEAVPPLSDASPGEEPGMIKEVSGNSMLVQCGIGLLAVREVQRAGGRTMATADFA